MITKYLNKYHETNILFPRLLLAVATLTLNQDDGKRSCRKIADRILASTTYEFKNTKTGEI